MANITELAKLLGEDNEKRLKDKITDIIIERVQEEMDDYFTYTIDYDSIFNEIEEEVKAMAKEKYMKMHMEKMNKKFAEMFSD